MVTLKRISLGFLFATIFATLSLSSALYPSQVNSLNASQAATATNTASTTALSASATSSSSATTQTSTAIVDSKNEKSSSSTTMVTLTIESGRSSLNTFTLPKSSFELLQKIFKLTKPSNTDVYAITDCCEYGAVCTAFNYFSRDEKKAETWLHDRIDTSEDLDVDEDNARRTWACILNKITLFGEETGDPYFNKNPRLQQFCDILISAMY